MPAYLYETSQATGRDVWAIAMSGPERTRVPVAVTPDVEESMAQFSPDGKWVAYQTSASGRVRSPP